MALESFGWCAVRKTCDREWLSLCGFSFEKEMAERKIKEDAKRCPTFDRSNPVVRVARVRIVEMEESD